MTDARVTLDVTVEAFPLANPFTISRGTRTEATVVVARLGDGTHEGYGECVPYARYGETVEGVCDTIRAQADALGGGMDRAALGEALPNGAARNALDCALWDLEAKRAGRRAWEIAGLDEPGPLATVLTISLAEPAAMEAAAKDAVRDGRTLLKVKLGGRDGGDAERMEAVRAAAPGATLIVDANEGWRADELDRYLAAAREARVAMVEQPLPAGEDAALDGIEAGVPLGADESAHTRADLDRLAMYDVVNVKLDKAGGLTEALAMAREAEARGFALMVGCMMATSLAMAPATLPAQAARFVDLDGPLWMARDRRPGLRYEGERVWPPEAEVWG